MKTYSAKHDEDIEIPTLQEDDDGNVKVTTIEDMLLLVQSMGYEDIAEFEEDTTVKVNELIGKWWNLCRDDVNIIDKE